MARGFSSGIHPAALARANIAPPARGPQKARAGAEGGRAGEKAEKALYASLDVLGIEYAPQYRWGAQLTPPRKFYSDAAIPAARVLIELDGQVHAIKDKRARDLERRRVATFAGWAILPFLPSEALDGTAALEIERYLAAQLAGHAS